MKLPEITYKQSWCCSQGCGICVPKQIDFEYSRTEDRHGNLIESKTEGIWVSECCEAELMLWDETLQDFVEFEEIK